VPISPQEREAGQKAYQRIKVFARNQRLAGGFFGLIFVAGYMVWTDFKEHGLESAAHSGAVWITLLTAGAYHYRRQKKQNLKDLLFLKELKIKYGAEVYLEIQKEPRSLYYYLVQKRYPPDNRQVVELP
jgi:hypothetical protein